MHELSRRIWKNDYLYFRERTSVTFISPFVSACRRCQYREKGEPWSLIINLAALLILSCLDITGFKFWMPFLVALWLNLNFSLHIYKTETVIPVLSQWWMPTSISQYLALHHYSKEGVPPTLVLAPETSKMLSSSRCWITADWLIITD